MTVIDKMIVLIRSLIFSFLMPIGEHLLKIVEQLEIVTSTTSDSLAAFRGVLAEEKENGETKSTAETMTIGEKSEQGRWNEWKSLGSELAKYGEQHERSALNKAELSLKDGVVGNSD